MDVERNTGRYNLRPGRCFSREEMEKKMRSKEHRLQTFTKHWPHHSSVTLSAECMARAGFYYEGEGDRVTCAFCREWLDHWEKDDVPHIQHKLKSPNCKFVTGQEVQKTGEAEDMDTEQECVAPKWDAARQCIPFISNQPAFQQYVNSEERKHTFNTWGLSVKTPDELIDAGFFYTKCEDEVRCFYCSVTLKQWNPNDQPWVEHARESPTCPFVLREHGSFFVDQVIQRENIREFKSQLTKEAKERGHTDHDIKQALHNNGEYFRNADEMRAMVVDQLQEAQGAITEEPADDVEDEYREGELLGGVAQPVRVDPATMAEQESMLRNQNDRINALTATVYNQQQQLDEQGRLIIELQNAVFAKTKWYQEDQWNKMTAFDC